ncbi:hypothetical protein ACHWQZ_G009069 [Mnemiopsis leidyi]
MSFHLEAVRRSKILARKKDAQFSIAAKKSSKELQGQALEDHIENLCREYTFPRRIISSYEVPKASVVSSSPSQSQDNTAFDKELWEAQKRLRNSCLYMGPFYTGAGSWSAA